MNYDTLLSAAHDYTYAYNDLRSTFPRGIYIGHDALLHSGAVQKYICLDKKETALDCLSECTGIDRRVLIQAARIEDRYYARGGTRCLDAEQLIRSLLDHA